MDDVRTQPAAPAPTAPHPGRGFTDFGRGNSPFYFPVDGMPFQCTPLEEFKLNQDRWRMALREGIERARTQHRLKKPEVHPLTQVLGQLDH